MLFGLLSLNRFMLNSLYTQMIALTVKVRISETNPHKTFLQKKKKKRLAGESCPLEDSR